MSKSDLIALALDEGNLQIALEGTLGEFVK